MSNATVGALNVKLSMELNSLQSQITQANAKIARMSRGWQTDISSAAKKINATLATIGIGASVSGLIAFGRECLNLGGQLTDLSYQAGLSTDAFQALKLAAMDNGASGEQVADTFARMRKSMQEAEEGNKTLSEAFAKLNLDAASLQKLAPERQFELIARAVVGAKDQQEAYNAAADIFGAKIAPKMMQFMQAIATGGFDQMAENVKNIRLTPEQLKTLDEAGDYLARIWEYMKLIGAKGIVGAVSAANPSDIEMIDARIKLLETLKAEGKQTYEVNGEIADVNKALENFIKLRDRANGVASTPVATPTLADDATIKRLEAEQKAAADAAALRKLEADALEIVEKEEKVKAAAYDKAVAAVERQNKATLAAVDAANRAINPSYGLSKAIGDIERAAQSGALSVDTAAAAIAKLKNEAVDTELSEFFGELDAKSKTNFDNMEKRAKAAQDVAHSLGMTFSSAFEDAIVNGEKLGDVLKDLARDILRLFVRKSITEPLVNSISGALTGGGSGGGLLSLFGFAEGGRPPTGQASIVGERGPELFVPDTGGNVISNDDIANAIGSGVSSGGDTIVVHQHFAAGVSQTQLMEAMRQTRIAAMNGVQDAQMRRASGFGRG